MPFPLIVSVNCDSFWLSFGKTNVVVNGLTLVGENTTRATASPAGSTLTVSSSTENTPPSPSPCGSPSVIGREPLSRKNTVR